MTGPTRGDVATGAYRRLDRFPDWVIAAVFLALAVVLALAGQLDDWLRAALSVCFTLLAIAFGARIAQHRR